MATPPSGDEIAFIVQREFISWPNKRKPFDRGGTLKDWVPLSGIVAQGPHGLTCIAAATGMKCLPQNKIAQARGVTLHDWHAEILAIRSFNRFLLEECLAIATSVKEHSQYIRLRRHDEITDNLFQPFALRNELKLHMYCSEAPCGDASMELTIASQEDATPWEVPSIVQSQSSVDGLLQGRSFFSNLGSIRRKPSRPDAPPTLSKSCSDKLALKQSTSLLSSITSLLISPYNVYLSSLVLPESQYSETACTRSFSPWGRLAPLQPTKSWDGGYKFSPFSVHTTKHEFQYSRRQSLESGQTLVPSNLASFSIPNENGTLIGGTLQGRKQFSPKGASPVCRARMWQLALEIARVIGASRIERCLNVDSYWKLKENVELLAQRRSVKSAVRRILGGDAGEVGWVRNVGGDEFSLSGESS